VSDLPSLLLRIQSLADGHADDPPERLLEQVEHTLTDGYAIALALEGERLRLQRELAADATRADVRARLDANERELQDLRARLDGLRLQAQSVRQAAASGRA
jgi:hypothetical protein